MAKYDRLLYISKSKKGLYDSCPLAFKYSYIDRVKQADNPFFKIGIDVHDFIEKIFYSVKPLPSGDLQGISQLKYHPNTPYKKNVVKFEIERWQKINSSGFDETFFMPVQNEKRWTTESPKLIGIVDRVHKCCPEDPFTNPHPEFKTGDLVIVENKTGKPTKAKCKNYEEDMLWYKIIIEIARPELAPIKWGAIYFPFNNLVYHTELKNDDCRKLAKSIKKTREQIQTSIETGLFPAKPSAYSCKWCSFRNHCPNVVLR